MNILEKANGLFSYTQKMRRDFHMHPELGFQEVRTSGIVAKELQSFGLEVKTGVGNTGVVAFLTGETPGKTLLFRVDMDALPIHEENETDYRSQNLNVMHACGHDAHTAIGLSVAKLLSNLKNEVRGTVKFVFQPAEEGEGGAEAMIRDGVLQNPVPDYTLGIHVWNEKPLGWIGISDGPVMSSADIFLVKITGKGGHGAVPHLAVDPIIAASHIITSLQSVVSRNVAPLDSAVVSVTKIEGGTAFNIIPPTVLFTGTIRTFLPETRDLVLKQFSRIITQVSYAFNCESEISIKSITLPVINNSILSNIMRLTALSLKSNINIDQTFRTMGSEDMSFLMKEIPGCFIMIGSANDEKGLNYPHHHPRFDIDESCLPNAVALITQGILNILNESPNLV